MYGWDEMSTLNLAQLARARDMAIKLVLAGGMDDAQALKARALAAPQGSASDPKLRLPDSVSPLLVLLGAPLPPSRGASCSPSWQLPQLQT